LSEHHDRPFPYWASSPTADLKACHDELRSALADGTLPDPDGAFLKIVNDLTMEIARRVEVGCAICGATNLPIVGHADVCGRS
jgi:hypothetical protein